MSKRENTLANLAHKYKRETNDFEEEERKVKIEVA